MFLKKLIRQAELMELLSVSRTTLWRMRQKEMLPKPIFISDRIMVWEKHVIENWLSECRKKLNN